MELGDKVNTNSTVDSISITYEEDGKVLVKELKKQILSKGAWTTIMFFYQEIDRATDEYKAPKISLRRYQKKDGNYIQRSKFTISSEKQAHQIRAKIEEWFPSTLGKLSDDTIVEDGSAD
jgi:hypothetical protein